ncbi:glycosyltransferase [Lacisediminihabitans sp. G11-30]|uniref:D-inositol 3-phosphate glycosyltransferase n=2 Tax=Lacisediminihabitans changchengi TaxID=2787634 RepID=A0A934W2X6_9MICO|nr:glycosyltransferase [Lacisediminihabitans changchengi]
MFSARLAAGLTERGHDVRVVSPASGRKRGFIRETHEGVTFGVYRLPSQRWYPHDWLRFVWPWRVRHYSRKILDDFQPDVIHIQSHIVVGRGLTREAVIRNIPVVATNHFMPENLMEHTLLPKFLRRTAARIAWNDAAKTYHLVSAVTSPSRKAADFLEAETDITDVHAVSCGIDASLYTPSFEKRTENRILFVGRVTAEKHIDELMKAVAILDPALDAKLQIVGGGDLMNQLQQLAKTLGIADRTTFTGYVTEEELHDALTHATVFAMPSIAELQSIATMEAMASGVPIVAADAMALPHLVHNGENGYLFTPGDVDDLAAKLTTVLTQTDAETTAMKKWSLRYIAAHDIQRTLSIFEALYRGEKVTDPVTDASLELS